jgi:(1->4)-alpha-D-glucan 1-alpha-D-glucosylmutase
VSPPRATLRLQLHHGFAFADASAFASYFAALGISHVYASPITTARRGSIHGYDVVDPTRINPQLGGEEAFRDFVRELRRYDLGLIIDIVPNHMAIGSENAWWMDVLARGRDSDYARYFDIDWEPPNRGLCGKVLLPVLGRPYGEALAEGEITLSRDAERSRLVIRYFDHVFPVAGSEALGDASLRDFDPASPQGYQRLHTLLERQRYRLAWWRAANDEINWRRFFDINELAALRVEDDDVFEAVHALVFRLYREGLIDGVRVDHIDGLAEPEKYCRALRRRLRALESERPPDAPGGPAYIVVEKILAHGESLPGEWLTDGTTGYDFMDDVSAVLHDAASEAPLRDVWQRVSGRPGDFNAEERLARRQILKQGFAAQREALVETLYAIAQSDLTTRDYSRAAIRRCVTEILVAFRVYRIYTRVGHTSAADNTFLEQAIERAAASCLPGDREVLETLGAWLSGRRLDPSLDRLQNVALARFQQLSAPLCAKAVEDTAFYRYGRLLSRNDVGFDPRVFALSTADFHGRMSARATAFPHAMLATATHDHKRGEDVRARLAVLSEIPREWAQAVERWIAASTPHCRSDAGILMPTAGDLAILFQTLVGAWPLDLNVSNRSALASFAERIGAWQRKALREAKLYSDWSAPNDSYERAATDYIAWLFSGSSELVVDIAGFAQRIAAAGAARGLAQLVVKLTAPGVPDIYQGCEYWDFSLVDPDNRLPVDFAMRQRSLQADAPLDELLTNWKSGDLKQFVIARLLALRKKLPLLFSAGRYLPLPTSGPQAEPIVVFVRVRDDSAIMAAFLRCNTEAFQGDFTGLPFLQCSDACVSMPHELQGTFSNLFVPEQTMAVGATISARALFGHLPIAVLVKGPIAAAMQQQTTQVKSA